MKTFREFLNERFLNYFKGDQDDRAAVVDEVWQILQDSYKKIGGIKGKGFSSKEDMMETIEMWKLKRSNNKIVTVVMYRDKAGRKISAAGTDGSDEGKSGLAEILVNDLKRQRAYFELSDPLLGFLNKQMGEKEIVNHLLKPSDIKGAVGGIDPDHKYMGKYPHLADYFYTREIGGEEHIKIAFGYKGNTIVTFGE